MDSAQDAPLPRWHANGPSRNRRRRVLPALAITAILAGTPAWASSAVTSTEPSRGQIALDGGIPDRSATAGTSVWARTFYKMLTYETMANTSDILVISALSGGLGSVGAGFLGANVATAATVYYGHEVAWAMLGPSPEDHTALVTGAKATTYRFLSVGRSFGLAYFLAGSTEVATSFALIGNIADTVIYIGNEWAWNVFAPPVGATAEPSER
jgi:uncharacterized membrane protein